MTNLEVRSLSLMLRLCSDCDEESDSVLTRVLTSTTRGRFNLVVCTCRVSSRAFDLLSPAARLCCERAATSTGGAWPGGEEALRLPRSICRGRTIFTREGAPARRSAPPKLDAAKKNVDNNSRAQRKRHLWEAACTEISKSPSIRPRKCPKIWSNNCVMEVSPDLQVGCRLCVHQLHLTRRCHSWRIGASVSCDDCVCSHLEPQIRLLPCCTSWVSLRRVGIPDLRAHELPLPHPLPICSPVGGCWPNGQP